VRRLFLSLFLSISAAFVLMLIGFPLLLERGFQDQLLESLATYASAPQILLEEELADVPAAQLEARIESLSPAFGYGIDLLPVAEVDEAPPVLERLAAGKVTVLLEQPSDVVYVPLRGNGQIARIPLSQAEDEHIQRSMQGIFFLLQRRLLMLEPAARSAYLQRFSNKSGVPAELVALNSLAIDARDRSSLDAGQILSVLENTGERYLKRLAATDQAIRIGPLGQGALLRYVDYIGLGVMAALFATTLFLWLRPLYRDMSALQHGANRFGAGNLDAQVALRKRSPLRDLIATFNGMARRLQALIGAQKELTDAVSHELRTPLSRLRFGMERLGRASESQAKDRYLEGMRADVDELDLLIDELLTYSRLNATSPNLNKELISDPEHWLQTILAGLPPAKRDVSIDIEIERNAGSLTADAHLMTRAVANLLLNAQRYARSKVVVRVHSHASGATLSVEDDGPGIPAEQRTQVFEPFARVEASRDRDRGGHGLGLAIVKRICEWHEAQVEIDDSPLGGARFRLNIPN